MAARRPDELALQAVRSLKTLMYRLAQEEGLARGERFPAEAVNLVVRIPMELAGNPTTRQGEEEEAGRILAWMQGRVEESMRSLQAWKSGHVYCYQCDSPDCSHSAPAHPTELFAGYSATGKPQWLGFVTMLLERKHPNLDALYDEPAAVIAIHHTAHDLKAEMLPAFGHSSRAFNVLGQVSFGLVPPDLQSWRGGERIAVAVQVVESLAGPSVRRLRMNSVGISLDDIATAAQDSPRRPADRLNRALEQVRYRLMMMAHDVERAERGGSRARLDGQIDKMLRNLATDVERMFRVPQQRTHHAQQRHYEGTRPTSLAITDACQVGLERFLYDLHNDTVIVLGPRNRTHVFSSAGRHVTSLQLEPGELERKTGRKQWKSLPLEQAADFRNGLREAAADKGGLPDDQ